MLNLNQKNPNLIKYMGSKTGIIEEIVDSLNNQYFDGQTICDLFSGSSTLSSALRDNNIDFISNDIQSYSAVLANSYTGHYEWENYPCLQHWLDLINKCIEIWKNEFGNYFDRFSYDHDFTLNKFIELETEQQNLIENKHFYFLLHESKYECIREYHLFTKYYSGTYWNFSQCIWIDSCIYVIRKHCVNEELSNLLLACLMYAMAYNSQSTGHYAQFRKPQTEKSMQDILIYRRKTFEGFFERKYNELKNVLTNNHINCTTTQLDFIECIDNLPCNTLVYADPPYCFVHYSRFYHILETLVKYDYPMIMHNGRYRDDRHQSPFCIATQVGTAFERMFESLRERHCGLVLSYSKSKTTMIPLSELLLKAHTIFNKLVIDNSENLLNILEEKIRYQLSKQVNAGSNQPLSITKLLNKDSIDNINYYIALKLIPYGHSTMGRTLTKEIAVYEAIIEISPL